MADNKNDASDQEGAVSAEPFPREVDIKLEDVDYKIKRQRYLHQSLLFHVSIVFIFLMTALFCIFCLRILSIVSQSLVAKGALVEKLLSADVSPAALELLVRVGINPASLDWHLLLLGSGLIIPPTLVFWGLIRTVMEPENEGKKRSSLADTHLEDIIMQAINLFKKK